MSVLLEGELTVKDRLQKQGNLLKGIDMKNVKRLGISRFASFLFSVTHNFIRKQNGSKLQKKKIINKVNCLIKQLILISQIPLF